MVLRWATKRGSSAHPRTGGPAASSGSPLPTCRPISYPSRTMNAPLNDGPALARAAADALRRGDARAARDLFLQAAQAGQADVPVMLGLAYSCRSLQDWARHGRLRRPRARARPAQPARPGDEGRRSRRRRRHARRPRPTTAPHCVRHRRPTSCRPTCCRNCVASSRRASSSRSATKTTCARGSRSGASTNRRPTAASARRSTSCSAASAFTCRSRAISISRNCRRSSSTTARTSRGSMRSRRRRTTSGPSCTACCRTPTPSPRT